MPHVISDEGHPADDYARKQTPDSARQRTLSNAFKRGRLDHTDGRLKAPIEELGYTKPESKAWWDGWQHEKTVVEAAKEYRWQSGPWIASQAMESILPTAGTAVTVANSSPTLWVVCEKNSQWIYQLTLDNDVPEELRTPAAILAYVDRARREDVTSQDKLTVTSQREYQEERGPLFFQLDARETELRSALALVERLKKP